MREVAKGGGYRAVECKATSRLPRCIRIILRVDSKRWHGRTHPFGGSCANGSKRMGNRTHSAVGSGIKLKSGHSGPLEFGINTTPSLRIEPSPNPDPPRSYSAVHLPGANPVPPTGECRQNASLPIDSNKSHTPGLPHVHFLRRAGTAVRGPRTEFSGGSSSSDIGSFPVYHSGWTRVVARDRSALFNGDERSGLERSGHPKV